MASSKPRQKRVISNDREDEDHPPTKRKKKVPEDQLKLERVLKSASKDITIIDKIQVNQKVKGHSIQRHGVKSSEGHSIQRHGVKSSEGQSIQRHRDKSSEGQSIQRHKDKSSEGQSIQRHKDKSSEGQSIQRHKDKSSEGQSIQRHRDRPPDTCTGIQKEANSRSVSTKLKQNIKSVPARDPHRTGTNGRGSEQNRNSKESSYFTASENDSRKVVSRDEKTKGIKANSLPKASHKDESKVHKESEYFRKDGQVKKTNSGSSGIRSSKTATETKITQSRKKTPDTSNESKVVPAKTRVKKVNEGTPGESKNQDRNSSKQGVPHRSRPTKSAIKPHKDTAKDRKVSPCRPKSEVTKEYIFPMTNKMKREIKPLPAKQDDNSDSEESDWEEVEDGGIQDYLDSEKSQLPSEPVTITLQGPDLMHKRRKKSQFDLEAFIRRRINRADQELQLHMHKVHLLCLLSHGFHRNRTCLDPELLAHGLSIVPPRLLGRDSIHWDAMYLKTVTKWFHDFFTIAYDLHENNVNLKNMLLNRMATREVASEAELVFLMVIILRGLGAQVRLVTSLQPVSHKCSKKFKVRRVKPDAEVQEVKPEATTEPKPTTETEAPKPTEQDSEVMAMLKSVEGKGSSQDKSPKGPKSQAKPSGTPRQQTKSLKRRSCASKVDYNEDDAGKPKGKQKSSTSQDSSPEVIELSSSDSDFEEVPTKFRKSPSLSKGGKKNTKGKEVVSSDSDDVTVTKVVKKEIGSDYFLEVYLERAENWIPIDCVRCRVNSPAEIESHATKPMYYVLGYDNDQCIKDVTSRYASGWMSTTRKLRKDEPWWEEVLLPYAPRNKIRDEAENSKLTSQQLRKPLPTSIGEFKNHPLYALRRHLLKFEAIYPEKAVPVGYIKGEPIYSRECVHELHTRETWLKEGRAVRVKEKPYKLVKARKKRSRKSFEVPAAPQEEQSECFGRWQTEQYMPPPAYNGKVPRNEYGNIEVFKPWMIPAGAVHLHLPGLNKVARKLNIDCAPAMVGWDFHGGYNHPVIDGFIVCEEHKDILLAAWDEEQEIQREKEEEKREQRALANWKKMVKSLLLREKMKKRFDLQEIKDKGSGSGSQDKEEKAHDVQHAWPANRPDVVKKLSTADQSALFPSEEI